MSHSHLSRAAGIRRRAGRRRQTLRWLAGLAVAALSAAALPLALRGDPAQADEGGAGGTVGTVVPGGPVVGGLSQSSAWWAHDTDTLRDSWPYTLGQGDALAQAAAGLDWVYRYSSKTGGIVWAPSIDDQFFTADGTNSLYSTCQLAIDNALVREPITDGRPSTRADFRAVLVGVVLGEYGPGNDYYTAIGHETWVFMQGYTGIVDWNLRDALARAWPEQQTNLTASASQGLADYRQTVHDLAAGVLTDLGPKALQVCVVVNKDFPARAFQPILATDLTAATPNQIVAPGTSLADAVTFSAGPLAAGGTIGWLTGTQGTANGTLYP
ncbi:MAG: hypothetical protein FWG11_09525, partial [Promicromonosporaceae bacterium]|nr:hypothetical protein [Promicromonosporaceae bacterium]